MKKRFTDTDKWQKRWFGDLNPKHKLLWLYCCDVCSAAGIVDFNPRFFSFALGFAVTQDTLNKALGDKIVWLEKYNKFFIPSFVDFQYGQLSEFCKPHKPIIEELKKWGLIELENGKGIVRVSKGLCKGINTLSKGYAKGFQTLEEKEKEREQEQEITGKGVVGEKDLLPTPTAFDLFWQAYPKYRIGNKDKARRAFEAAQKRTGISAEQLVAKAKEYAASEETNKDGGMFAKGAAPWLNDDRFLRAYAPAKTSGAALAVAREAGTAKIDEIFGGSK
nr:MAG TPA_asm: putative replisome organizer protein [Caudoviricetes sp.]